MDKSKIKNNKNIHQRMLAIMNDVEYIQKKENAAKGLPYKFVTHDQVTSKLHVPMVRHGIFTKTDILECIQEGNRSQVKARISFINVDDPQDLIEVDSYGYGIDNQDKGIGKAISYASKMALLKNFMLGTGEDPEKDNIDFKKEEKITIEEATEIQERFSLINEEQRKSLFNLLKVNKIRDIKKDQYQKVLNHIQKVFNNNNKGE